MIMSFNENDLQYDYDVRIFTKRTNMCKFCKVFLRACRLISLNLVSLGWLPKQGLL